MARDPGALLQQGKTHRHRRGNNIRTAGRRLRVWVVLNSRLPSGFSEERVGWLLGVLHALTCVMEEFLRDPHALEQSHAVGSIHAS